jgi:hypothetical protein
MFLDPMGDPMMGDPMVPENDGGDPMVPENDGGSNDGGSNDGGTPPLVYYSLFHM